LEQFQAQQQQLAEQHEQQLRQHLKVNYYYIRKYIRVDYYLKKICLGKFSVSEEYFPN